MQDTSQTLSDEETLTAKLNLLNDLVRRRFCSRRPRS